MRERTRLVMTAGIVCVAAAIIGTGFGAGAQSGAAANDDALEGMADLRPRSRRHALFAAHANHSGERRASSRWRGCIT